MAHTTITLYHKGCEFEVDCEGDVSEGGSNSYGRDEPAWIEVDGVSYSSPSNGKPLSERLSRWIDKEHGDYVAEMLIESHSSW